MVLQSIDLGEAESSFIQETTAFVIFIVCVRVKCILQCAFCADDMVKRPFKFEFQPVKPQNVEEFMRG